MKKFLSVFPLLILLGAGCARSAATNEKYVSSADLDRVQNVSDTGTGCSNVRKHLSMTADPLWARVTIPFAAVSVGVPYSPDWSIDGKQVTTFDSMDTAVVGFGPYIMSTGCHVVRTYTLSWEKQVSLDDLMKRNVGTLPAQKTRVGPWDAVIYGSKNETCFDQKLAVNAEGKTFTIYKKCQDITDEQKGIGASIDAVPDQQQ